VYEWTGIKMTREFCCLLRWAFFFIQWRRHGLAPGAELRHSWEREEVRGASPARHWWRRWLDAADDVALGTDGRPLGAVARRRRLRLVAGGAAARRGCTECGRQLRRTAMAAASRLLGEAEERWTPGSGGFGARAGGLAGLRQLAGAGCSSGWQRWARHLGRRPDEAAWRTQDGDRRLAAWLRRRRRGLRHRRWAPARRQGGGARGRERVGLARFGGGARVGWPATKCAGWLELGYGSAPLQQALCPRQAQSDTKCCPVQPMGEEGGQPCSWQAGPRRDFFLQILIKYRSLLHRKKKR
jgi:hypothetical protein